MTMRLPDGSAGGSHHLDLPYLTSDRPGASGQWRVHAGDFVVEEIPAYEPCGAGEHLYLTIEKSGLSTAQVAAHLARSFDVRASDVGYAGRKDADAVSRQTLSVHTRLADIPDGVERPGLKLLGVARHRNKLRLGHLRGNRFVIRLRNSPETDAISIRAILGRLETSGVPNYFGEQRFGFKGDTGRVGRAMIRGDWMDAVRQMAGDADGFDDTRAKTAASLFAEGAYADAARHWPSGLHDLARLSAAMADSGDPERAIRVLDKRTRQFYVSAFQSMLFNDVLAQRIGGLDRVYAGDVAYLHRNGAMFSVTDEEAEQPRAAQFEISATGPLFGPEMKSAGGIPAAMEAESLRRYDVTIEQFPTDGPLRTTGGRRPLRIPLADVSVEAEVDEFGPSTTLRFALPAGGYATSVMREILKPSV